MRAFCFLMAWALAGAITLKAAPDLDTDGDGQTDSQELAVGTNPNDEFSVQWKSLAAWRFNDGTLADDRGAGPVHFNAVSISPGIDGSGLHVTASDSYVRYRSVAPDGKVKIAPRRGSIWLYVKPDWYSDFPEPPNTTRTDLGLGPGHWATVLETENFSLKFNPKGTHLVLTSLAPDGSTITNINLAVDVRSLDFRPSRDLPGFPLWYNIMLTYTPEHTSLTFVTQDFSATGPGIAPSTAAAEARFIVIGSNAAGDQPVRGVIDEVIAFNALGAMTLNTWQTSAIASNAPGGIQLIWNSQTNAVVNIRRRVAGTREWSPLGAALGTSFFDATAEEGVRYEYNVNTRVLSTFGDEDFQGQFTGGTWNGREIEHRGKVILLVDQTLAFALEPELSGFITNLVGDGWQVLRANVPRHVDDYSSQTSYLVNSINMATFIKPFLRSSYAQHGDSIRQILILGHVTVPYSGTLADDGHYSTGQHQGAWSTDNYYGDMDGTWTDGQLMLNSFYPWNWNYPGDGKFDQDFLPQVNGRADLEVPVARIDLANLPAFEGFTEVELLKRYLAKNAAFRAGQTIFPPAALAFDTHVQGRFSQVPIQTGTEMASQLSVLGSAAFGDPFTAQPLAVVASVSGPGGFVSINSLMDHEHSTEHLANGQAITPAAFYFVRSSYMPDWNTTDNLLRAILASPGGGLASAPMFIPHTWRIVGLALGDMLGSDVADVINNWKIRQYSIRPIQFQGDATLRYPVVRPPFDVSAAILNDRGLIAWSPSPEPGAKYHVYRSTDGISGAFERLNAEPLVGTTFVDQHAVLGNIVYMVRALAMSTTGAGTFTNISQGAFSLPTGSPSCCIADRTILEDTPTGPIDFELGSQADFPEVTLTATSSDHSIVPPSAISITGTGPIRTIRITPAPDQSGLVLITVSITTAGGTTFQGFWLTIVPVNDPPSFTRGPNLFTPQGAGLREVPGWAKHISAGPWELGQQVTFEVSTDRPGAFVEPPSIAPNGTLSYSLEESVTGNIRFSVRAHDDGGTANGGSNQSAVQEFILSVGFPLDSDSDGLPDDYEVAIGTNPFIPGDGAQDSDGDGFTNLQEFWAGTNPFDPVSLLEISQTVLEGESWRFRFSTVQGKDYTIEYNDAFPTGQWHALLADLPGTGSSIELSDAAGFANSSRRVYRVRTSDGRGNFVSSQYAGYLRLNAPGASDTLYSQPFIRHPEARGRIASIAGNLLTIAGNPGWSLNRWIATGGQTNNYYLMICSGTLEGEYFTITGNTDNIVALDLAGGSLAGLTTNDRVMIVPYSTLASIFPGGRDIHPSTALSRRTLLIMPDTVNSGINLSPKRSFYYFANMFHELGFQGTNQNRYIVFPDECFWVRHNIANPTTLTAHGAVLHTKFRVPLRRRASGEQDNFIAIPRPGPVTMADLGLTQSAAFRPSPGLSRIDKFLAYPSDRTGINRAPSDAFFYDTQWRKFGVSGVSYSGTAVFEPGRGFILRLNPATTPVLWINSPNY
jgi:uncharacterized protein (TIGR02597 family)